jgi:hypothetical protein
LLYRRILSGDVIERRIIRVALGAAAIEGCLIRLIQGSVVHQPAHEIRIGDERFAEADQIRLAIFDRLVARSRS